MSSNLKTADFDSSILPYKIITDSSIGSAAIVDVPQESGTLYYVTVDAVTGISHDYFLKLCLTSSEITVGTTVHDVCFQVKQGKVTKASFPGGIPFSSLSAWVVDASSEQSSAHTTSGNSGTITLTMVTT